MASGRNGGIEGKKILYNGGEEKREMKENRPISQFHSCAHKSIEERRAEKMEKSSTQLEEEDFVEYYRVMLCQMRDHGKKL